MPVQTAERRIALLKDAPLFADLAESQLAEFIEDFRVRKYRKGEVVFRQGDESREVYLVLDGKIRIFKISPSGDETSIVVFSKNDLIGEMSAIDNDPRSATAKAINAVTLLAMSHERFLAHIRDKSNFALRLIWLLSQKLRWTASYAESVAQFDAAGRLLHIILLYTEQYGEVVENAISDGSGTAQGKEYVLDLALNQTDLATMVGARREWVNRILNDWRKRGLLTYSNGVITILDLDRVQAERDSRIEVHQEW